LSNLRKPPSHLSKKAQKFFSGFVEEFEVDESAIEVLTRVCESQDRADQAAKGLKDNGSLTTDLDASRPTRLSL
jgi:phage terminase small subunit